MSGFNYEKNQPHQMRAVSAVLGVFDGATPKYRTADENPELLFAAKQYANNILKVQSQNGIDGRFPDRSDDQNILDISMETGTGKTYTYTQTMFELHRWLGVFKFIVVVPTLSIKAGTQQFLQSKALAEHFEQDFGGDYEGVRLKTYVV
ncbi:DEAD/DEAH box helicase family protein, partial [Neisseria gonorrhoeae]